MWSQIGIKLTIEQADNPTRTQRYRDAKFLMRMGAWTDDIADPNERASYFVYSPNISALHSGWKSDAADKLFEDSQKQMDPAKRAQMYAQMQEIYNSSGPIVPLYETPYPVALSKKVHGFLQIPLGNNIFASTWIEK
jgi:peptide/nickel transport system substrate-binding protein